jgi:hypothetical protein
MKKLLLALSFLACCAIACKNTTSNEIPDIPENIESTKAGRILEDSLKKVYREQLYFAAAGTNVDSIRHENWMRNYALKQSKRTGNN